MPALDYASAQRSPRSSQRIWIARGVAVVADLIQLPLLAVTVEGAFSPVEDGIDLVTAGILTLLVGPHLAFVPSFLVKLLPIADLAPTWTIAVLIATGGRQPDALDVAEPLAPVPMLSVGDPGGRRTVRSAKLRATVWFAVLFVIGFAVGGVYLMPHLPPVVGHAMTPSMFGYWERNWAGALLGGVLGLWSARTVLRRAGRS